MNRKKISCFILMISMAFSLSGCAKTAVEEEVATDTVSENTVSENIVSENAVSDNSISDNTVSANTVSENTISENALEEGLEIEPVEEDLKEVVSESTKTETPAVQEEIKEETKEEPATEALSSEVMTKEELSKCVTWTASNGVMIYLKPGTNVNNIADRAWGALQDFEGIDMSPESAYRAACMEWIYDSGLYEGGEERYKVDIESLPDVATVSSKLTSFELDDTWAAYKSAWNPMFAFQATGVYEFIFAYSMGIYDINGHTCVGNAVQGQGYIWSLNYLNDYWELRIKGNLTSLQWDAVHMGMRRITSDADALYNEFYKQSYSDNPTFPDYDMWVNIGSSQALATFEPGTVIFRFK